MKSLVLLAASALMLAGCASTSSTSYADHRSRMSGRMEKDLDYVQAVESQARQQGVEVHWVHIPDRPEQPHPE